MTRLQTIANNANAKGFKFKIVETEHDVLMLNVWSRDYKPTNASIDAFNAIKHYCTIYNKYLHVIASNRKVRGIFHMHGLTFNFLSKGKGDISPMLSQYSYVYSWRSDHGNQTKTCVQGNSKAEEFERSKTATHVSDAKDQL